jgi:hypothetical protein
MIHAFVQDSLERNMKTIGTTAQPNGRIDMQYGLYRLIAGRQGKEYRAIAYLGNKPRKSTSGNSVEEAVRELQKIIDDRVTRLSETRLANIPSAEEFRDAFESIREEITERQVHLLRLHRQRPGGVASFSDLSRFVDLATGATRRNMRGWVGGLERS